MGSSRTITSMAELEAAAAAFTAHLKSSQPPMFEPVPSKEQAAAQQLPAGGGSAKGVAAQGGSGASSARGGLGSALRGVFARQPAEAAAQPRAEEDSLKPGAAGINEGVDAQPGSHDVTSDSRGVRGDQQQQPGDLAVAATVKAAPAAVAAGGEGEGEGEGRPPFAARLASGAARQWVHYR